MSEVQAPAGMQRALQVFTRENGTVPVWDNPNFKATLWIPTEHKPFTRVEQALESRIQHKLSDDDIRLIKVIGDSRCVNEAQLRKYMQPIQSASRTSKMLEKLRFNGYVQRYKCSIRFEDEDSQNRKPPGVFVLGIIGYKLLRYLYPTEGDFIEPEKWMDNSDAIQRYVAMNAIREAGTTNRQISSWKWYPAIGNHSRFQRPFAVMATKKIEGQAPVHFIMERVQMSQTFLDHLAKRLNEYRYLYDHDGMIMMEEVKPPVMQAVVISVSTVSLAEFIQAQMSLHHYPYDILFMIDEWLEESSDLSMSFAQGTENGIPRVRVPFFQSLEEKTSKTPT